MIFFQFGFRHSSRIVLLCFPWKNELKTTNLKNRHFGTFLLHDLAHFAPLVDRKNDLAGRVLVQFQFFLAERTRLEQGFLGCDNHF